MRRLIMVGILLCFSVYWLEVIPKILYPIAYQDIVRRASEEFELDSALIFSVIRTESRFQEQARSNKGAIGLMQIMEETGQFAADALKIQPFNATMLFNPEVNIRIGSWYLSELLKTHPTTEEALAAYNAGGSKVKKWLQGENASLTSEKFLQKIPYPETRFFVKTVMNARQMYRDIYWESYQINPQ